MLKYFLISMLIVSNNTQHAHRTVLLFADNSAQKLLKEQQALFQTDNQGLKERDIEVKIYSPKNTADWKRNYIRSGFTIVLIGKDGGEKLRGHKPITTKKLFNIIDAMPMRKEEISHAGGY